jgi:beta-glucosidase-like glycosyl hydrolase
MKCFLLLLPFLAWASPEEMLLQMTLEEKIGQLFVAPACPMLGERHFEEWQNLLSEFHIGNVIVKQADPLTQVRFLNRLQREVKHPLLVAADAEWGLAMRMKDTIAYPRNMTLGAIQEIGWIERLGREVGRQAKLVGIHMNLAPVADVNYNPKNPIIHMRSFGEDPTRVAECVAAYISGLQASGVWACAKHFPGHGDTEVDSHRDLPVIAQSIERLRAVELVPFQRAVEAGVAALMTAHLYVPDVDEVYPTSLSSSCLQMAREQLRFQGLIVSDALNMKAVADRYSPEEVAFLARKAGCDLLLYGDHIAPNVYQILHDTIPRAFRELKRAYLSGELSLAELDVSILRILRAKESIVREVSEMALIEHLHTEEALTLKRELFEQAVTLLGEASFPLPEKTAYVSFGEGDILRSSFPNVALEEAEKVVVAIHQKEALTKDVVSFIQSLGDRAIVCFFATPYALKSFPVVLLAYENDPEAQRAVLRVLRGQVQATGKIPVYFSVGSAASSASRLLTLSVSKGVEILPTETCLYR